MIQRGNTHGFHSRGVQVVDTMAAGDSFIAAIAKGYDVVSSVKFADKVATIVVTRKGAQSSIPSLQEVEEYLVSFRDKGMESISITYCLSFLFPQ